MGGESAVGTPEAVKNLETVEVSKSLIEEILARQETKEPAFSLVPKDLKEAQDYAQIIARSNVCPKDYKGKPDDVVIAIQYGIELGLKPLQALQCIAVINGRPAIWGDGALAVVLASGLVEDFKERSISEALRVGEGKCVIKRKGRASLIEVTFSKEDAQIARLWGKEGPWSNYPGRMLQMRARGFALRDGFADVLKGIAIAEEVRDFHDTPNLAAVLEETFRAPTRKSTAPGSSPAAAPPKGGATPGGAPLAQAPAAAAPPPADQKTGIDEARVKSVEAIQYDEKKEGKATGRKKTWWKVTAEGGRTYATFSETHSSVASTAASTGALMHLEWEVNPGKPNLKLKSIDPVPSPMGDSKHQAEEPPFEPGADG